jgi:hypothetical protein
VSTKPPASPEKPTEPPATKEEPKNEKLWRVKFTMSRTVELRGPKTGAEAEERARDKVLFEDDPPIDREDIDSIEVAWVNEEVALEHVDGCYGNHCRHFACSSGTGSDRYCANCDPD